MSLRKRGEPNWKVGVVYFAMPANDRYVKIGWAQISLDERLRWLRQEPRYSSLARMVASVPGSARMEGVFHRLFHPCRLSHSEMFVMTPELRAIVDIAITSPTLLRACFTEQDALQRPFPEEIRGAMDAAFWFRTNREATRRIPDVHVPGLSEAHPYRRRFHGYRRHVPQTATEVPEKSILTAAQAREELARAQARVAQAEQDFADAKRMLQAARRSVFQVAPNE